MCYLVKKYERLIRLVNYNDVTVQMEVKRGNSRFEASWKTATTQAVITRYSAQTRKMQHVELQVDTSKSNKKSHFS
jgi:hypothetical protein